jgi:hypothetical protein
MKRNTRLQHTALVLALAAAYPIVSHGAAGTAQFAAGDVTYKRGNAAPAALTKGTTLESGDAITTGARGIAQVKFSDGGYVAIQPNSQFDITRYADSGNAQQDSFLVNLARGGMRAITGLIGKRNTANYKVTTNTATVGIRGSSFTLAYGPNGEVIVTTEQDGIEVCTTAGCTGLTAGESAIVTSPNSEPSRTNATTTMPLVPYRQDPQVAGNQANPDGTAAIIAARLTGSYDMAFAWSGNYGEGGITSGLERSGQLHFGVNGAPSKYVETYGEGSYSEEGFFARDDAVTVFTTRGALASSDLMVLGLWSGAEEGYRTTYEGGSYSSVYDTYSPLAFVAGQVTPEANISSLNMVATYSLSAATPVITGAGTAGTLNSANLSVDFFSGTNRGQLDMNLTMPTGPGTSTNVSMYGTVSGEGSYFSGEVGTSYGGPSLLALSVSGGANVRGFFGGQNAQWAGLSYNGGLSFYDGEGSYYYDFGGAAILGRDSATPLTGPLGVIGIGSDGGYTDWIGNDWTFVSSTGGAINYMASYNETGRAVGPAVEVGSLTAGGQKVSLTHWADSLWQSGEGSYSYSLQDVVFVAGVPTSNSTISSMNGMSATYSLTGGVKSSAFASQGGGPLGTLDSATLSVMFNGSSNTGVLDMAFSLTGSYGGASSTSISVSGGGNYFYGTGALSGSGGGTLGADGVFYGPSAEFVGLIYESWDRGNGENFHGGAILTQTAMPVVPEAGSYSNLSSFMAFTNYQPGVSDAATTGTHVFNNSHLSTIADGEGTSIAANTLNGEFGHTGSGAAGDFIGWGKWESADVRYNGSSASGVSNVHYIVGQATPGSYFTAPERNGVTATYTAVGGTTPTASNGGTGSLQTQLSELTVAFSATPTVSATVNTLFGSSTYVNNTINDMPITGGSFGGANAAGTMNGLFAGPNAERAGLVYTINGGSYGTVTGAVGFNRNGAQ